jgi:hypothetical protein
MAFKAAQYLPGMFLALFARLVFVPLTGYYLKAVGGFSLPASFSALR